MSEIQLFFEDTSITMQNEFENMLSKYIHENILDELMAELNLIMKSKKEEIERYIEIEQDKDNLIRAVKADIISLEKELKMVIDY